MSNQRQMCYAPSNVRGHPDPNRMRWLVPFTALANASTGDRKSVV